MRPLVVPEIVEAAVRAAAERELGAARVGGPALTRAVVDRSRRYTSERELLALPLDPDADLAARACFFTVADCAKPMVALAELASAGAVPAADPLRVVDLGAGCGAMSLGLALALAGRTVELVMIDHDDRALAIGKRAVEQVAPGRVSVRAVVGDVATAVVPRCDLVLIGSVLNELAADVALAVATRAMAAIRDDGAVIIIEPALRDTARALHALRDQLIAAGGHMFAPCGHDTVPCPMLADERDWCHEERPVTLPPRTRQLANATGLRDGAMKFSYLTMRRAAGSVAPGAVRVVGHPRAQKGKHELEVCGTGGYAQLRLLTRHKSEGNRGFLRAERGDLLAIEGAAPGAGKDVGTEDVVRVIRPAEAGRADPEHG